VSVGSNATVTITGVDPAVLKPRFTVTQMLEGVAYGVSTPGTDSVSMSAPPTDSRYSQACDLATGPTATCVVGHPHYWPLTYQAVVPVNSSLLKPECVTSPPDPTACDVASEWSYIGTAVTPLAPPGAIVITIP
jgi:hypothetical protein